MAEETLNQETQDSSPVVHSVGDLVETVIPPTPPSSGDAKPESSKEKDGITKPGDVVDDHREETEEKEEKGTSDIDNKETKEEEKETEEDKWKGFPPIHEHERFQELLRSNKTLQSRLEALEGKVTDTRDEDDEEAVPIAGDYKDMAEMTEQQLTDWHAEDPKGYLANHARQIIAEATPIIEKRLMGRISEERAKEENVKVLDDYAAKHGDFDTMWASGDIQRFMDSNPGHTPISAHAMLTVEKERETSETKSESVEERIKKAREEGKKEAEKNFKTKRTAKSLDNSPSSGDRTANKAGELPAELADTKAHGGPYAVLYARSVARQKQAELMGE
jgi:hypothetical protein